MNFFNFSLDNYSVLNNYDYTGKSKFISLLDWGSAPCRRLLGGRKVAVQTLNFSGPMTTTRKVLTVAAIALAAYIYIPLAVVPFACLVLKMATFPWFWEKARINAQIQEARVNIQANEKATQEKVNEFFAAKNSSNWNAVIQIYMQNTCLAQYEDVYTNFFNAINHRINQNASWDQLQGPISRLRPIDANTLINLAISQRLNAELQDQASMPITSPPEIMEFIRLSLPRNDLQTMQNCYEHLLSNILKVDPDHKPLLNMVRLDLADRMITHLTQVRIANAESPVDQGFARLDEVNKLRPLVVSADAGTFCFYKIFNKSETMQRVSSLLADIRSFNIFKNSLNGNNVVLDINNWNEILRRFGQLNFSQDERPEVQVILGIFGSYRRLISDVMAKRATDTQINDLAKQIQELEGRLDQSIQPSGDLEPEDTLYYLRKACIKNLVNYMTGLFLIEFQQAKKAVQKAV